jgi:hypothetical protein
MLSVVSLLVTNVVTVPTHSSRKAFTGHRNKVTWGNKMCEQRYKSSRLCLSSSRLLSRYVGAYRLRFVLLILKTLTLNIPPSFLPTTCYTF